MNRNDRHPRAARTGFWLLALLLAFTPLPSLAQPIQGMMPASEGAASPQVPCHSSGGLEETASAPQPHDCPHCTGDAVTPLCQCYGQATQGTLAGVFCMPCANGATISALARMVLQAAPESPGEDLFRPPIIRS